jgi:hypothetical protein
VLHCPYCHGWEVRDRVIWNGPDSVRFANIVRQWMRDLVLFAPDDLLAGADGPVLAARSIAVVDGGVDRVAVDQLSGSSWATVGWWLLNAVFVPPRLVPNDSFLSGSGV